jgi:hypothetical protein
MNTDSGMGKREGKILPRIGADERGSGISWNPETYANLAMRWDTKGGGRR